MLKSALLFPVSIHFVLSWLAFISSWTKSNAELLFDLLRKLKLLSVGGDCSFGRWTGLASPPSMPAIVGAGCVCVWWEGGMGCMCVYQVELVSLSKNLSRGYPYAVLFHSLPCGLGMRPKTLTTYLLHVYNSGCMGVHDRYHTPSHSGTTVHRVTSGHGAQ